MTDPLESRRAKRSVSLGYYELTELLAIIDRARREWGDEVDENEEPTFDWELVTRSRQKMRRKARSIEKQFEQTGEIDAR